MGTGRGSAERDGVYDLRARAEDTWVIDVFEVNRAGRTGAYAILSAGGVIVVDPGGDRTVGRVIEGLRILGADVRDITAIVVTHVHLDHAGGVGRLVQAAPQAMVYCHPRAARHLKDPSKLIDGARAVYGRRMSEWWGETLPVPEWRIRPVEDLGAAGSGSHALKVFDSPGHARHHATYLDERTGALYTGDAVGLRYVPDYTGWTFDYGMPTTSPSDFDPAVMLKTLDRLSRLRPVSIMHTHFGASPPEEAFSFTQTGVEAIQSWLSQWGLATEPRSVEAIGARIEDWIREDMARQGHGTPDLDPIAEDIRLNALGILAYWTKRHQPIVEGTEKV